MELLWFMQEHGQAGKLPTDAVGRDLLRTALKVTPAGEDLSFQARAREQVRFHYELG
ncbi:MAG: hypothetical protein AAF400_02255 [Bacteroidota bacterium]